MSAECLALRYSRADDAISVPHSRNSSTIQLYSAGEKQRFDKLPPSQCAQNRHQFFSGQAGKTCHYFFTLTIGNMLRVYRYQYNRVNSARLLFKGPAVLECSLLRAVADEGKHAVIFNRDPFAPDSSERRGALVVYGKGGNLFSRQRNKVSQH